MKYVSYCSDLILFLICGFITKYEIDFHLIIGKIQNPGISVGKAAIKIKEKTNVSRKRWKNTENKHA